jgi:von Willebrand factor type A domain
MRSRTHRLNPLKSALLAGAALVASVATASAAPCAPNTVAPAGTVGLEFILDNSTSMGPVPADGTPPNDPNNLRVTAAQLGLSQLADGDTVGVMKFSDLASTIFAPTVLSAANRQTLSNQISAGIGQTTSGTNYEDTFNKAVAQLADMCAAKKAVIFLSDGIPTRGNIDATNYTTLGVPVYTISLGIQAATRLQTIAQATAGQYYFASDATVLQDAFTKAVSAARGFNNAGAVVIKPSETKDTVINVPAGTTGMNALVGWPLNSFKVTLVTPTGQVIDGPATAPAGTTATITGTSANYVVANPAVGKWTLKVLGAATNPQPGTNVSIAVLLTTPSGTVPAGSVDIPVTPPVVAEKQAVSKLKAARKALTRGKALVVTFDLKLAGKVKVLFARSGAKGGAKSISVNGKAGTNKVTIPAKFFAKTLKRGSYRITIKPDGATSQKLTLGLK